MIEIRRERLTMGLVAELEPLIAAHHAEIATYPEVERLQPKWSDYLQLQHMDMLEVFTARRGGKTLIGYSFFLVTNHMHYADLRVAVNDVFYVHPDFRRGPTPLRFLRYMRTTLKDLRVRKITFSCREGNNLCAILERLGYRLEERVWSEVV